MTETTTSETPWTALEDWSAWAFLLAGGLVLVTTGLTVLDALGVMVTQGPMTGIPFYIGLLLSYVGLLGLYPRLGKEEPRLARLGAVIVVLPVLVVLVLLVWGVLGYTLSAVPLPITVILAFGLVFVAMIVLFAVGIALYGVASLRTPTLSRIVGGSLLILAATWVVLLGASAVYGTQLPAWVDSGTNGVMAITLLAIGYLLRIETESPDHAEPAPDTAVR